MLILRFPFKSREEWLRRIQDGFIRLNDHLVTADAVLNRNHVLTHFNPRVKEPAVPDQIEIIEETEDYLVVLKPAPMPVHPGGRYFKNSLIEILKEKGHPNLKIIHRLDAVTSGLLIFGKNSEFTREIFQYFQKGQVTKQYYALVSGCPQEDEKIVDIPIRRKEGFRFECDLNHRQDSKSAITRFEVRQRFEKYSLIACYPETGRTHQIRLHLLHWGYPIYDDPIYGFETDDKVIQNRGIHLFNAQIEIPELNIDYLLPPPDNWNRNAL